MAHDRFTNLSILNIKRDVTNKLDENEIVNKFVEKNKIILLI
jgi:hypothetical protein